MTRASRINLRALGLAILFAFSSSCGRKPSASAPPRDPNILVVGEIVERSKIPDPARSDYPDCLYSASVRVAGHGASASVPEKIMVLFPAFKARKLDPAAGLKAGDLVKLRVLPDKEAPKAMRETQRADALTDFSLPVYYAMSAEPALAADLASSVMSTTAPAITGDKTAPATPALRYPWSPKAAAVRKLVMDEDITRIREGMARHGGSFDAWQNELRPMLDDLNRQTKAHGGALAQGAFYYEHLRHVDYRRICMQAEKNQGPFQMLVSMSRQLRERGMDLLVIPYPQKEEVNADIFTKLAPEDGVFEPWRLKFFLHLLEADVEVLDVIPSLRAARANTPDLFYPVHDGHPADGGLRTTAGAIAGRLERYDLLTRPGFAPRKFSSGPVSFTTNHHEKDEPEREYKATEITWADGSFIHNDDDDSHTPAVILGDSFTSVPKPYGVRNASVVYQLAPHLGELPDSLTSMGGSPQFLKVLAREGGSFYEGRCTAVFMFSPNALLNDSKDEEAQWLDFALPAAGSK